jgi:hypothetical protein
VTVPDAPADGAAGTTVAGGGAAERSGMRSWVAIVAGLAALAVVSIAVALMIIIPGYGGASSDNVNVIEQGNNNSDKDGSGGSSTADGAGAKTGVGTDGATSNTGISSVDIPRFDGYSYFANGAGDIYRVSDVDINDIEYIYRNPEDNYPATVLFSYQGRIYFLVQTASAIEYDKLALKWVSPDGSETGEVTLKDADGQAFDNQAWSETKDDGQMVGIRPWYQLVFPDVAFNSSQTAGYPMIEIIAVEDGVAYLQYTDKNKLNNLESPTILLPFSIDLSTGAALPLTPGEDAHKSKLLLAVLDGQAYMTDYPIDAIYYQSLVDGQAEEIPTTLVVQLEPHPAIHSAAVGATLYLGDPWTSGLPQQAYRVDLTHYYSSGEEPASFDPPASEIDTGEMVYTGSYLIYRNGLKLYRYDADGTHQALLLDTEIQLAADSASQVFLLGFSGDYLYFIVTYSDHATTYRIDVTSTKPTPQEVKQP